MDGRYGKEKKKTVFFGQHHDFDCIPIYVQQYRLNLKQVDCKNVEKLKDKMPTVSPIMRQNTVHYFKKKKVL